MTFAYWMLIAAMMMPYLTILLAKVGGGIDNRAPRPTLENLSGWRKRADWAHRNHFEAFPAVAAAVFVAELTHAPQNRIDLLSGIFVLLRVIYTVLYIAGQASCGQSFGRSALSWLSGFSCSVLERAATATSSKPQSFKMNLECRRRRTPSTVCWPAADHCQSIE